MKQNRVKQAKLVPISCGTGPTLAPVKVFLTLQFGFSHISFIQIYNRLAIPPPPLLGKMSSRQLRIGTKQANNWTNTQILIFFLQIRYHAYIYLFITICLPNPSCEIWSRIDVKHSLDLLQGHFQSSHSDLSKKKQNKNRILPKKTSLFSQKNT